MNRRTNQMSDGAPPEVGRRRFSRHESSAPFAVPGGCRPGRHLGQDLAGGL
ncbi:hypothetical protein [Actinoallomurus sp. NPDC052274]|uniref:hypothetical protein n=1 Tax=Actinoallomurus sp. NPDC052274 TaxID=3155420 RepID=UPI0034335E18